MKHNAIIIFSVLILSAIVPAFASGLKDAQMSPADAAVKNAACVYPYIANTIYKIYCRADRLVDIQMQPGEEITYIGGADTVRWVIDQEISGGGVAKQWHIYVKPNRDDPKMSTSFCINTNIRSYHIEAYVSPENYTPIVCWSYPHEEGVAIVRVPRTPAPEEDGIPLDGVLNFSYSISGPKYDWVPIMAFDDGRKTYIRMPESMSSSDAPVLYIKENGKLMLVNYRVKNLYYIVDRLFRQAEMRNGKETVTIERKKEVSK